MRIVVALLIVWLVVSAVPAAQRGYFAGSATNCAQVGTIAVTIVAGPLNYVGVDPQISCVVPQLSTRGQLLVSGAPALVSCHRLGDGCASPECREAAGAARTHWLSAQPREFGWTVTSVKQGPGMWSPQVRMACRAATLCPRVAPDSAAAAVSAAVSAGMTSTSRCQCSLPRSLIVSASQDRYQAT
jgi:hypothetical protein